MDQEKKTPFTDLGLADELMDGIRAAGFEHCTPIQAQTLPHALQGKDVAGQAQTGTGKTAAFLLASMQHLLKNQKAGENPPPGPRALMIAPTRELAIQIKADADVLGQHTNLKLQVVFGGADYDKQRDALAKGVDILVGTPGRLIDYYKQGIYTLKHIEVIVLDEADRMFDLGFIKDIRYVLRRLPPADQRLNLMFSATLNQRVLELAYEHMNEPTTVRVEPDKMTADRVTQSIYFPSNEEKGPLLIGLLRNMSAKRTMVFVNTKREAEYLERLMQANGFEARAISGDVRQNKRISMLKDFQTGDLPVLIATDVASRGLHVPDVSHVINYDLPQDREDYVHRIGRTARAGASGDAISFACETYAFTLPEIEDYIGHRIPAGSFDQSDLPQLEKPAPAPPRRKTGRHPKSSGKSNRKPRSHNSNQGEGGSNEGNKQRRRRRRKPASSPKSD